MNMLEDYQAKLNEQYDKLIHIQPKRCEVEFVGTYGTKRKVAYKLCMINGVRYASASDVARPLVERRKTNVRYGYIKDVDMPYLFANGQKRNESVVYINIDRMAQCDIRQLIAMESFFLSQANAVIAHAQKESVENVIIDQEEFERGQQAYREIQVLRREMKRHKDEIDREREEEYERRCEERRRENERLEENTLRELVQQIEDMGWHVTLSCKG